MHHTDHSPIQLPFCTTSAHLLKHRIEGTKDGLGFMTTYLHRANRRVVRNSPFQPKKWLKTCYFKSFIQRVLKMVLFKASWPYMLCTGRSPMTTLGARYRRTIQSGHVAPKLPYTNWFTPRLRGARSRAHTQLIHDAIQILPANSLWKPSNCNKWNRLILLIDTWLNQLSISTLISTVKYRLGVISYVSWADTINHEVIKLY